MGFLGSVSGLGYVLNFLSFPLALLFTLVAFLLGWIGFSVSDWLEFTTLLGYRAKFGLWNYCTLSLNFYSNGYSCTSWYKLSGMYIPSNSFSLFNSSPLSQYKTFYFSRLFVHRTGYDHTGLFVHDVCFSSRLCSCHTPVQYIQAIASSSRILDIYS